MQCHCSCPCKEETAFLWPVACGCERNPRATSNNVADGCRARPGTSTVVESLAKYSKYDENPRAWIDLQNEERSLALSKWLKVVLVEPLAFRVARNYYTAKAAGLCSGTLLESVADALSVKATATLHGRANKLLEFVVWARGKTSQVFPIAEGIVYAYFLEMQDKAAATSFRGLLSSVAFAKYTLGLLEADAVLESGRVAGLSAKLFMQKRKLRQRNPLRVKDLCLLEEICAGGNLVLLG